LSKHPEQQKIRSGDDEGEKYDCASEARDAMNNGHYDFRKPFMSGPWNRRASKGEYILFWNGPILNYEFTRAYMIACVTISQKGVPVLQSKEEKHTQEHQFRN